MLRERQSSDCSDYSRNVDVWCKNSLVWKFAYILFSVQRSPATYRSFIADIISHWQRRISFHFVSCFSEIRTAARGVMFVHPYKPMNRQTSLNHFQLFTQSYYTKSPLYFNIIICSFHSHC